MKLSFSGSRQLALGAGLAVVVLTALGVALFLHAYASLSREAFRDRAAAYAQAFATIAESWLARGQEDVAATLAAMLVTGSVRSVTILDVDGALRLSAGGASVSGRGGSGDVEFSDRSVLRVEVPMPSTGSVRLDVDTSSVDLVVRHATTLAVAGAVLFDAGVIALLAWALRRRRGASAPDVLEGAPAPSDRISVGALEIVPARCEARYAGTSLGLTPKQFAVLGVLASKPGKVFTEAEILAAAWPDSPYADARDIKQYVYLLRRRLAAVRPEGRDVIVTVPGFGYRLDDGH